MKTQWVFTWRDGLICWMACLSLKFWKQIIFQVLVTEISDLKIAEYDFLQNQLFWRLQTSYQTYKDMIVVGNLLWLLADILLKSDPNLGVEIEIVKRGLKSTYVTSEFSVYPRYEEPSFWLNNYLFDKFDKFMLHSICFVNFSCISYKANHV